jgi:hypothetical protein
VTALDSLEKHTLRKDTKNVILFSIKTSNKCGCSDTCYSLSEFGTVPNFMQVNEEGQLG